MEVDNIDDHDVFDSLSIKRKPGSIKRQKKRNQKGFKIKIKVRASSIIDTVNDGSAEAATTIYVSSKELMDKESDRKQRELEFEDSLSFFAETHEDQDPAFVLLRNKVEEEDRKKSLAEIEFHDQQGKKEIEDIVNGILQEKQGNVEKNVATQKNRILNEGKLRSQRLDQVIRRKSADREREIQKGIEVYKRRHQEEFQSAMRDHKRVHQQRLNEAVATNEWAVTSRQLQAQQGRELADFRARGEEVMKKMEHEYKREVEKNEAAVAGKLLELQRQEEKMQHQLGLRHQQSRQRHLQRHAQMIEKQKRNLLESSFATGHSKESPQVSTNQTNANLADQRPEFKQADALESMEPWAKELDARGAAAVRHKHRRAINSQSTARQLSVEVHNEGLRLSAIHDGDEKKKLASGQRESQDFIPWGAKSYAILEAILYGEIPIEAQHVLESHPNATELTMNQGGQVRCVVFDLRTSETTASTQRALAVKEHEESSIREYETKQSELNKLVNKADSEIKRLEQLKKEQTEAMIMVEERCKEAKRMHDEFREKYSKYFAADGSIIQETSEKNRDELAKAIKKFTASIDSYAQKLKIAKLSHDETATRLQKSLVEAKNIQKTYSQTSNLLKKKQAIASRAAGMKIKGKQTETVEMDRAAARVDDIIGSLHVLANKRRHNAEQSRTASFRDKWMESIPELTPVVKDSLFLRMQRRSKHHIILRPTTEMLVNSLRSGVDAAAAKWPVGKNSVEKAAAIESAVEKAEQIFLLATHPLAVGDVANIPTTSENRWAEPGCLVDLSVPNQNNTFCVLPRQPTFSVFEHNLAEFSSSYGRQCASFTNSSFLRSFNAPLSCLAVAGSIAESESVVSIRCYADDDPLRQSDELLDLGYTFHQTKVRPSSPTKKKPPSKSSNEPPDTTKRKATSKPTSEQPLKTTKKADVVKSEDVKKPSPVKRAASTPSPRSQRQRITVDQSTAQALANRSTTLSPGFGSMMQQQSIPNMHHSSVSLPQHQPQSHQPQQLQPHQQQQQLGTQRQQPQFQNHPMAHLQLMQQQPAAVSPRHQVNAGFPQHALMQQLYGPLGHPNPMAHMHMQNRSTLHAQQQHHFQQNQQRQQQQLQQLQMQQQQLQHQHQQQLQHQQQFQQQQQQQLQQQQARKQQNDAESKK